MRFLILNADYTSFIERLYDDVPGLDALSFDEQMAARNDTMFGLADFYSRNLRVLGHEAVDIIVNNDAAQRGWARENGITASPLPRRDASDVLIKPAAAVARRILPPSAQAMLRRMVPRSTASWRIDYPTLEEQIRRYQPDILLNQAMDVVSARFLSTVKTHTGLLVGQIAAPLPDNEDFTVYDLVISSLPNFVEHFRALGIRSELHPFAFEPRVLDRLPTDEDRSIDVSFVGSYSDQHRDRNRLLESLSRRFDIQLWGQMLTPMSKRSPIMNRYQGTAWGLDMYRIFRRSKIVLNFHIGVSGEFANNMRMFEATGTGALLLTDWKENLGELFVPGEEVVTYRSTEECEEKARFFLENPRQRECIAAAGQSRTLRDHAYPVRMQELVDLLSTAMPRGRA